MEKVKMTTPSKEKAFNLRKISTYKNVKLLIFGLIIYLSLTIMYNMAFGSLSETWKETEGTIVKSAVAAESKKGEKGQGREDEKAQDDNSLNAIRYEYQVNGKKYVSGRISYPQTEYRAEKGASVKAYYWELLPSFSVLAKGNKTELNTIIQFGVLVLLAILLIMINPPDKEKEKE